MFNIMQSYAKSIKKIMKLVTCMMHQQPPPAMEQGEEMEGLNDHIHSAKDINSNECKAFVKIFGKIHELPCTCAIKTRVKNLMSKLSRLQSQLVRFTTHSI
jgi:hypothetical protein